ncbi:MATE family efflux transporter [uncultured Selenomonas sp.]|uniref:MATE family efflux transporter n=1 Tax=uncultured Selenomonas sp. TaxID=159275 RepID=UPI0028D7F5AB|nr:MATE family efflux transporter [uncultured Selenomonas sp.]
MLTSYDKNYLRIGLPAALEGVLMIFLSNADIIMVGSLGTAAIAAVSIFTQPRMILLTVARSVAAAVTILVAERFGRDRHDTYGDILKKTMVLVAFALGSAHILFFLCLDEILLWMGAQYDYLPDALLYGTWTLPAVFITSLTVLMQAVMFGRGESMTVLSINMQGNVVNVVLNAVLIFGLGPFPQLGVLGAALGTIGGAVWSFVMSMRILLIWGIFRQGSYRLTSAYLREFFGVFGGIFSEQGFERIGMVLYTRMVAELGTVAYAVHSIAMNFCDFYYNFCNGMGKASTVLAGHNRAIEKSEEWRRYLWTGMRWSLIFSTGAFLLTYVLRSEIFGIYAHDPALFPLGSLIIAYVAVVSFPEAYQMVCAGILRASGKTTQVAAYSFVSITILRPIITYILVYEFQMGLEGAWLSLAIDQSTRALCAASLLRSVYRKGYSAPLYPSL